MLGGSAEVNGFLGLLDERVRAELVSSGTERTYRAGRFVYDEGRSADTLAVLLHGRVKVSVTTRDGTQLLLAIRGPGELIGELSTLVGAPRSATVTAIDEVRLLVVSQESFDRMLTSHPQMSVALIAYLARRVRESDGHRIELEQDTDARVARELVRLFDRFGRGQADGTHLLALPLTQDELAALTWATRGSVARALRRLREAGMLRTSRRAIVAVDLEALRESLGT